MNLNYSEKENMNERVLNTHKTCNGNRPIERVNVTAHAKVETYNGANNSHFFNNKLAKNILRARTKVYDAYSSDEGAEVTLNKSGPVGKSKKRKANADISGVTFQNVESVDITNLMTRYTRDYIIMHSHLPFMVQSIYLDELAAYTLAKGDYDRYSKLLVNKFYVETIFGRTYMNSQFGITSDDSTFTFLNDLTLSTGDSGLTEPKLVGSHVAWENGKAVEYDKVVMYKNFNDNLNYWKKFRNATADAGVDHKSGSVVFDILLMFMFADPAFRNLTPGSLIDVTPDDEAVNKLSTNLTHFLAYIMTKCYEDCSPRDANNNLNDSITLTVDDAVTLLIAFFAAPTRSGMALANCVNIVNAKPEEVIIKEDPVIELDSLNMILPSDINKFKPKYRKYKNAFIKLKTQLPKVGFAGYNCVKLKSATDKTCACYAKLDSDGYITAYVEDVLDFSNTDDSKIFQQGNKDYIQKEFKYSKNPVQLVIDGFIAAPQVVVPAASDLPNVKISHRLMAVTSSSIQTKAPVYMVDYLHLDPSYTTAIEITDGIFVHGLNSRMPIIENRQVTGWCSSLTDDSGKGIRFFPLYMEIDEYASGDTYLLGGEERVRRRQCVQYLGKIADGMSLDQITTAYIDVGFPALGDTNAKIIALDDKEMISVKYNDREYKWPRREPYSISGINANDALDQEKLLTWLRSLTTSGSTIKGKTFFVVMYSRLKSDDTRFKALPGTINDYELDHTITDSSVNNTGKEYAVNGQGELFSNWMDPATGNNVWRKINTLDMETYYYFEGMANNTYYRFDQGFESLTEAQVETTNHYVSKSYVSYKVADEFYIPELLLTSCSSVFVRSEKCLVGDARYPTMVVAAEFSDADASLKDWSHGITIRSNGLNSVLSESALRSFTTKRVPRVKLAQILLSMQDQHTDIVANGPLGSFRPGKFGMVVDAYLLRELVKTSKEKRSIRTFNMFKALFDAITVEPETTTMEVASYALGGDGSIKHHPIDDLLIEVDDDFGVDVPELSEYVVRTADGVAKIPFNKLFEGVTTANLVLPANVRETLDPNSLAKYQDASLIDILKDYIDCSDYADTESKLEEVKNDMDVQLAYITNAKEQLMNEYANLSADTVIMNLENAMDAVEDTLTDSAENTEVIVDQTITDIKNSVITQFNDGASDIGSNLHDYYSSFIGECERVQSRIAEKVRSEAEKVSINAKKFYTAKLQAMQGEAESNNLSFSLDSLFTMILQHNDGILSLLGEATGLISGSNAYLGWQDSTLFTPTSTLTAVSGAAKSGLEAAVSTAYHLVSRAVTTIGDNVKRIVTETWKDGVSYHIRNSGFNTLGLQAATLVVDRAEFEDRQSNWYWLGKQVLSKLDGTNSYYITAQVGPCLIFIQDYSQDQIIITLNPVMIAKDDVLDRNDYYMAEAEADSVRYTLTFINEIQKILIKPDIALIDYTVHFRVPDKSALLYDILSNAKGKSAAATWGLRGLILGLGVTAGALLLLTGFGSAAGGALILGATTVGLACTGEAVDQSKVERLQSDSVYANGVIMSSDLASIWTSSIPTAAVRLCMDILSAFSNVEYDYNGHTCIGSLCHSGDGLVIDIVEALGKPTTLDEEPFSFLGYIPMITYAGTPTFKYTLVTDRERFLKQSALMLGSVVAVGSLAAIAVKSGFKKYKRKRLASAQAQQYAGVKPKAEDFRKVCKNADGTDVTDELGNPITVIDVDAYQAACNSWDSSYSYQLRLQKKVNRWTRSVSPSSGGMAGGNSNQLMNIFGSYATPEGNEPIQYVIKRMG